MNTVILKPVLTEKSVNAESTGKYTLFIAPRATKVEVKQAIQALYGVDVASVNIKHQFPKTKVGKGRRPVQKKARLRQAIVTLKAGQKLDLTTLKTVKS